MPLVIHSKALILRGVTSFKTSLSSSFRLFDLGSVRSLPQRLVFGIFASLAEFERELIRDRVGDLASPWIASE
jgi:DNA invertase Pin-like site-specific DNA recombinase